MPELPEVEVVKQSLEKYILNKKILKIVIKNKNLRFLVPKNLSNKLSNQKILKVNRISKYVIIEFENGLFLIIHLGMSGTLHLVNKKNNYNNTNTSFYGFPNLPTKHNHVLFFFRKYKLIYNDPRRFGFIKILENKKSLIKFFKRIGPEPTNIKFNTNYIKNFLKGKNKNIKNLLLDQKFVSGIGNIYANEILYYCKINPLKKGKNLNIVDIKKILNFSNNVLKKAIKRGGSSIKDFKNTKGKIGDYQKEFRVYQRENLNCLKYHCNGKIKKIVISKRSSFFCNNCQK